jgi:hypothetical protein
MPIATSTEMLRTSPAQLLLRITPQIAEFAADLAVAPNGNRRSFGTFSVTGPAFVSSFLS